MNKRAFLVHTAKILLYFLLGLVGSAVFGVTCGFLGADFGNSLGFPTFGGAAQGYEAGGVFLAIVGISLGALLTTFLLNKLFKRKQKYAELAVVASITALIGLLLYDYSMPVFTLVIIFLLPSVALTVVQHWEKLRPA